MIGRSGNLRVLLTNDDGISAPGLAAAIRAFESAGVEVAVAAPAEEKSASSHSVSLRQPIRAWSVGPARWAVAGTPVDAVNLAVNYFLKSARPDLVISGINQGANLGCDIHYSGTVAAARESALLGIPAFAISLETFHDDPDFGPASRMAVFLAAFCHQRGLPPRTFLNVNVPDLPASEIKGWRVTVQGQRRYDNAIGVKREDGGEEYYFLGGYPRGGEPIPDSDIMAVKNGYVSISPLGLDLTRQELISWLREGIAREDGLKPWI